MSENETVNSEQQPTPEPAQSDGIAAVREAKERADARAEQYRTQLVETRLKEIGLSPTEGLGVAVAESFKGEPTLEEISAFASEKYKYTYNPQAPGQQAPPANAPSEQYQQAAQSADQLMAGTQQAEAMPNIAAQVQQADARFDQAIDKGEPVNPNDVMGGISAKLRAAQ